MLDPGFESLQVVERRRPFMEPRFEILDGHHVGRRRHRESSPRRFQIQRYATHAGNTGIADEAWIDQPRQLHPDILTGR